MLLCCGCRRDLSDNSLSELPFDLFDELTTLTQL